ncbi:hypothetical protein CNMCM5793_005349 [Aspergillus hiratsukae]|uniref:Uncharacterized protein n=1 Tax=Aspergillus hiratsukae TaxID=1194566 RepID=A0A8H6V0I7_9EURO|nr:hypothetical protein CNMCM5793_005349 [Aspergillus hiratsukae]KAF7170939.1 hypothetical protein CNMCM6106_005490 [Aspergillus hiratsukae]
MADHLTFHPMVQATFGYKEKSADPSQLKKVLENHLSQFAGSGVWLPELKVYLLTSRVVYTRPGTSWPTMSFLRGRIFDEQWRHLENYTVEWYGKKTTFPLFFDIPTIWWEDGSFFGPEDPRIILKEDVQGVEPIIVFNMIMNVTGNPRTMWIFKPFSHLLTPLTIQGEERKLVEKNWAPFFYRSSPTNSNLKPSEYLHFIYSFNPLQVLKCRVENGSCEWFYKQNIPDFLSLPHPNPNGEMRGGTNLVPIPISGGPSLQLYVGFPRTHVSFCKSGPTYRPELVLLSGVDSSFHIAYASLATDFGNAVLDQNELDNPCTTGGYLIPSSILRWDLATRKDIMTLSFSVADNSTRIIRLSGMLRFVHSLPYMAKSSKYILRGDRPLQTLPWSVVGREALLCSLESAANSSRKDSIEMEMEELRIKLQSLDAEKMTLH